MENDNYKHLVPPGPKQCSSNRLFPHYQLVSALQGDAYMSYYVGDDA
jgi:hypothetical protein